MDWNSVVFLAHNFVCLSVFWSAWCSRLSWLPEVSFWAQVKCFRQNQIVMCCDAFIYSVLCCHWLGVWHVKKLTVAILPSCHLETRPKLEYFQKCKSINRKPKASANVILEKLDILLQKKWFWNSFLVNAYLYSFVDWKACRCTNIS